MKICFPARKHNSENYATLDEMMGLIGREPHGSWLAGTNMLWHGGIHISTVSAPGSILNGGAAVPLQCMAGGEVVAWRLNQDYLTSTYNHQTLQYSSTFVLVKSTCKPDPDKTNSWLDFYSLYLGLAPLSAFTKNKCYKALKAVSKRKAGTYESGTPAGQVVDAPQREGTLAKDSRVIILQEAQFLNKDETQPFGLAKVLDSEGKAGDKTFWVTLLPQYMAEDGEQYAHLPVWMQHAVAQGTFDAVVKPATALELAAGDAVGFLAKDIDPVGRGTVDTSYFAHVEVLCADPRMPDFLNNPAGIKTGAQYVRIPSGKSLYSKRGEGEESTFTAMSCVIVKDSGKILPVDKCHPLKDKQGKTWYEISAGSWMSQEDVELLHQYDLKELGFTALEEESTDDMTKSLHEGWMKSAFSWLSEQVRPEKGIQQQQVSGYYKKAMKNIDTDGNGKLSGEELFHAVHHPEMEVRNIAARMVVKHDSEWFGGSKHHKWAVYLQNYDRLRLDYTKKWLDDMEWMSQVAPFNEDKPVWHMHPVMFLGAIADKFTDTIDFQTTLGVYRISKKSAEFILSWESYVSKPYVPAGDQSSGVTVGYGYDLGQQTVSAARAILTNYYTTPQVERLISSVGKKGDQARGVVNSLSDISITKEKALDMAMVLKKQYCQTVVNTYPQAINLPPDSAGAILSLIYNRGPSLALPASGDPIDRRLEMREIRDDFTQGNLTNIPARLRGMKRLWPNQQGLVKRREGEAKLIENELSNGR